MVKFVFCHSKLGKQPFFLKFPNSCGGKRSYHTIKNWCNLKRFNTILNSEILLNLRRKLNISRINFNCVFVFALATLNTCIHLCIGNTIGILTDNLLVATYALPCLCIPVSNAVVEWVFSHVTSVLKMWKSCDFECVSMLRNFYLFFKLFLFFFNSPVATPAHRLLGLSSSF